MHSALPLLGLVPGMIWLLWFSGRSRPQPRSFVDVGRVFLWGGAAAVPTLVVGMIGRLVIVRETSVPPDHATFLLAGPIEEFFKLTAVWIAVYRGLSFREPIDGPVYAVTAALGFASVENVYYMAAQPSALDLAAVEQVAVLSASGPQMLISRVFYATPAHIFFSCMWGCSLGRARFVRDGEMVVIAKGFLLGALLHTGYNGLIVINPPHLRPVLVVLLLVMGSGAFYLLRSLKGTVTHEPLAEGPVICCPNCGAYTKEDNDACERCGADVRFVEPDAARYCGRCRAQLDPCDVRCPGCWGIAPRSRYCPPGTVTLRERLGF